MPFWEFLTALLIAVYAMVGGALINASLTAPQNARAVLARLRGRAEIGTITVVICAVALLLLPLAGLQQPRLAAVVGFLGITAAANLALILIFWGCWWATGILIGEMPKHQKGHSERGHKKVE